ncbi:esterase family protein [Streptomyces sp. ET3-23]|uniref:alpha/beta hydrolase n=1 Tax=Streptomyces sp. ET3-23 TaxID=2885643 RepID=UPI001D0FC78D|nr:alpha/beta hydrolase-fold protein [Streptomyces sp. ET3-23]MCC2279563.1 esterase family protein [Streptomyces sp. ET3-23]
MIKRLTVLVSALGLALIPILGSAPAQAAAADPAPPALADGYGLTQVGTATGTAHDFTVTVTTPQVAEAHPIRIILPSDYNTNPAKRYPVLYFLHGSPDEPANQSFPALLNAKSMITVIPDGGRRGWYANWRDQDTAAGAQNWENFHIDQVIPFIDANLRTIASKKGRAVAGISMGGFGAFHYAQDHPELFSQTASFSGDIDMSVDSMDLRLAVVASLTNGLGAFCSNVIGDCNSKYGPTVSSDALFGSPYPVFNADWKWNEVDPSRHMDRLKGKDVGVSIYVGNGNGNPLELEFWLEGASKHVKDNMDAIGMPYYYVDYGNGSAWGGNCNGGHNGYCWARSLEDYVPRLEQAFASAA